MINKVIFQGRFTASPELKQTQSAVSYCAFTVAWSEKYKEVETQAFLDCRAWRQTAEFIPKYFHKGDQVVIEGHLITQKWTDTNGQPRSKLMCEVDKVHFCGAKAQGASEASEAGASSQGGSYSVSGQTVTQSMPAAAPQVEILENDEELPF